MLYYDDVILPAHHFRSSALYKKEIHNKVNYLPTKLTKHGFREEQIFSYKCLINGFKIGVDTQAIAWHQLTTSGGERFMDSNELISQNEKIMIEETKELYKKYGNFIDDYNKKLGLNPKPLTKQQLMMETNLTGKIG